MGIKIKKSIMAGIFINIAATIYLSVPNKIIGSLLFTFGLFAVLVTNSNLYTGVVGYANKKSAIDLLLILFGNITGCFIYSTLYSLTSNYNIIHPIARTLCETKFNTSALSILVSSIFCGVLMFIAVNTFKQNRNIIGVIVVILCVSGFILAGFDHSIANISYIALSKQLNIDVFFKVIIMIIGNGIGSVLTRLLISNENGKE